MLIVHHAKNCRALLEGGFVNEGLIGHSYTQPSHAICS